MSIHENPELDRHVPVDASLARVDRLWRGVSARLGVRRRAFPLIWAGAAVCALAGTVLVIRSIRPRLEIGRSAWEGAYLETAATALAATLFDGSTLKLDPRSRVEVGERTASSVKLVVTRGRLACDVTHRTGRSFVVAAAGVEVRVVGTRFSVSTTRSSENTRVEVQVERGVVEVHGSGSTEIVRLEAGRRWSQVIPTGAAAPATSPPKAIPPQTVTGGTTRLAAIPSRPHAQKAAPIAGARQIFEQARDLWREGRIREAALAYQALLIDYPRDPRAGLAAFELGRLRMDRLNDMPGAVRALERAVALAPGAELREDAMARLVAASAGAHEEAGCQRARDQYLAEYPAGVHRRAVAAACSAP